MAESSSWLTTEFIKTMRALGAEDVAPLREEATRLLAIWGQPERVFHSQERLISLLATIDSLVNTVHEPAVLQAAVWYHCVVLHQASPSRKTIVVENYPASADQALERLPQIGVTREAATRVAELILALSELSAPADDMDAQVFIDSSLTYLGSSPQDYRESGKLLRAELSCLDERIYARLRRSFVSSLLERDAIFHSPQARVYENNARQNLSGELSQLNRLLPPSEKNGHSGTQAKISAPSNPGTATNGVEGAASGPERASILEAPALVREDTDPDLLETTQTLKIKSAVKRPVVRKSILGEREASGPGPSSSGGINTQSGANNPSSAGTSEEGNVQEATLSAPPAPSPATTETPGTRAEKRGAETTSELLDSDASSLESVADIIESLGQR